jgi:hypothetical protein
LVKQSEGDEIPANRGAETRELLPPTDIEQMRAASSIVTPPIPAIDCDWLVSSIAPVTRARH